MPRTTDKLMWVVCILREGEFHPLHSAPCFDEAPDARAWAYAYLKENPNTLMPGVECLTWRAIEAVTAVH